MNLSLIIAALSLFSGPDPASRTLVGADLSRQTVTPERLELSGMSYVDGAGVRRSAPASQILAVYAASGTRVAPVDGLRAVVTSDGQRLVGMVEHVEGDEETIAVVHPTLGRLHVALDRVRSISEASEPSPMLTPGDDTVILSNGDLLRGFVAGLAPSAEGDAFAGGSVLLIDLDTGSRRRLGLETVSVVLISNPQTAASGPRVWLSDGSAIGVREAVAAGPGLVRLTPIDGIRRETESEQGVTPGDGTGSGTTIVLDNVIGWMPDAKRLSPLASAKLIGVTPVEPRPWTDQPTIADAATATLGAPDILLPGPSSIEWELPEGTDGLSCEVVLPEAYRDWGDCEVVILAGDAGRSTERWRGRLNAGTPTLAVRLEMADRPRCMVVRVDPGEFGAVQDRPTLIAPLLRITPR
ncbi:MAG: hypothetical protein KF838_15130 [Phycisphaeraceae bacterium]|nr:MAG: hypothetical protein KF838_15130 [Phycisphaeraceae bacterium]